MDHDRDNSHTLRVLVAFGLLYVIWGSTYFVIRLGISSIPPALFAALRMGIAGILMLLLLRLSGHSVLAPRRELWALFVVGCLLLVCGNGLVVWSEQYVASGLAALIIATVPLWISILGAILPRGERLSPAGWTGVALGLLGLGVLLWPKLFAGPRSDLRGEAALVLAALSWACGSLYSKRVKWSVPPLVATGWEMLFAGIVLLLIGVGTEELQRFQPNRVAVLALVYLIVFGSCMAFSAYIWLLQHVPAAKVTTYAYVNPVIAVALGWMFLDEPFTLAMMIGTPIIVVAVALVITAQVRTSDRAVKVATRTRPRAA